jgi:hypothetical protein
LFLEEQMKRDATYLRAIANDPKSREPVARPWAIEIVCPYDKTNFLRPRVDWVFHERPRFGTPRVTQALKVIFAAKARGSASCSFDTMLPATN